MYLQLVLPGLLALILPAAGLPAPDLEERQTPAILLGTCTLANNTCQAPYPWGGAPVSWACGRYANALGTVINTPSQYCTVDGHVRLPSILSFVAEPARHP